MTAARRVTLPVIARALLRVFGITNHGTVQISTDAKGAVRIEARQTYDEAQLEEMGPVRILTEDDEVAG